jgi:peptide/nickel transport system substrate-binding protein
VRQALRLALDRPEIIDKLAHGIGVVEDTATPISAPYYVDVRTTPYDPAKANALLDQAGWTRGPDGRRAKNGVNFGLNFAVVSGAPDTAKLVGFVTKDWQRVGVQVRVHHYSPSVYFATGPDGVINGNVWDGKRQ